MGGDHGLSVTIPACARFLRDYPQAHLCLSALPDLLQPYLNHLLAPYAQRIEVLPAQDVVAMDELPSVALRRKKHSSVRLAIDAVKANQAQAVLSAGNTGALMTIATVVLRNLPEIDRAALASQLPNRLGKPTTVLDLGASLEATPTQLLQFAVMGAVFTAALNGNSNVTPPATLPRIGLLNVGHEEMKGGETLHQAAELLKQTALNFVGNVEGNDIFTGKVDVVVCDGFVGNVALKASEGLAKFFADALKETLSQSWWRKLLALPILPLLQGFKKQLDHRRYNGACLLGLNGIVVKSHGSADELAFYHALVRTHHMIEQDLLLKIRQGVQALSLSIAVPASIASH
jgi:glycerol-3-phosphate acyltransferase PlsX